MQVRTPHVPSPSLRDRVGPSLRCRRSPTEALITAAVLATLTASIPPQRQFEELGKRGLPADNDRTHAVALGDVDGDGDLDMVAGIDGGFGSRQNRLYLNDGTGIFTDATAGRMPSDADETLAVALGDLDGDGDLDIVLGNDDYYGRQNRIYINDGAGFFTDETPARLPAFDDHTHALSLGDVDGDGDYDIVVANRGDYVRPQNRLYLNDGAGFFTDATAMRLPSDNEFSEAVDLGDVDGDGDLDMVFGNAEQQNRLYVNDGTGTFADVTSTRMPPDSDGTRAVTMGDVDGDGDLDIALGNDDGQGGQQNRLYLNDGAGSFTDATAARMPADNDATRALLLGDADGDGDLDMIVGNGLRPGGQQNRFYLNDGSGFFTDATAARMPVDLDTTLAADLADVDGDADLDLVFGNSGNFGPRQDRLYLNDGIGFFVDATAARIPADNDATAAVALGDVDGDGDGDLVIAIEMGQNRLYLNDGCGLFTDATAARMPAASDNTRSVALGDVDGDDDLDVVFGNVGYPGSPQNRLYLNDGAGNFTDATASRMPPDSDGTNAVALGDVDDDGDLDMVLGNSGSSRQNRLYLNDGNGFFTDVTATHMPTDDDVTIAVAFGDIDGDDDLDMVFGNYFGQQNRLYVNDGAGTFTDATAARMPVDTDSTNAVALGDVDGDDDLDMVLGNSAQQDRLYLNDGTGSFTDATAKQLPTDDDVTRAVALGDVDEDGDLDILLGGRSRIYLNAGGGIFTDETGNRMSTDNDRNAALVLGDIDNDGDLDLVFGNLGQDRLYQNFLRHLDAPFLARAGQTFTLEVHARFGAARNKDMAWAFLSTDPASLPQPRPGNSGIGRVRAVRLPPIVIPQPAGMASASYTVPNDPSLIGSTLYAQVFLAQHPRRRFLTNLTADVIGRMTGPSW